MPTELQYYPVGGQGLEVVNDGNPLPVTIPAEFQSPGLFGIPYSADMLWRLGERGQLYIASDAAQGDMVTGQTSFAATTPTFLLRVPAGTLCVPLFVNLSQSGTVAGAAINTLIEIDDIDRYSSGGTVETVLQVGRRSTLRANRCTLVSGATALTGYGVRVWGATLAQDVSPAEGAVQGPFWRPEMPYQIEGPGSLLIFTYAGTTGPTWLWSVGWAEFDINDGS